MTEEKKTIWNTPYPITIMNALRSLFPEKEVELVKKERSPRGTRRLLGVCAVVSLVLVWLVEGFVNPLEYLVDLPIFSYSEMVDVYPGYEAQYYIWLLAVTSVLMTVLKRAICRDKEFPIWTVNGVMFWIVGLAVAILADALTRNIIMERFAIPAMENANDSIESARLMILSLVLMHFCAYFVVDDLSSNCMSALLTPYVMAAYEKYFPAEGLMRVRLIEFLVLTLVLKLILIILDKCGVTGFISDLLIKYSYTPKYIPMSLLYVFAIPFLPFLFIGYLIRRKKTGKTD